MKLGYIFTLLFALGATVLLAQPANDECVNAIPIPDPSNYCSTNAQYTNVAATQSSQTLARCFPQNQSSRDVWFSFVAVGTDVGINLAGNTSYNQGGTLRNPQLAIYSGACGSLTEVGCISDSRGDNAIQVIANNLVVGNTYYIRISARNNNSGTFQFCVNNFNEVPKADGDCPTAVVLCDKESFSVPFLSGEGRDPNEISRVSCSAGNCPFEESSSTWYKWTCKDQGTLTFSIFPLKPIDDIDFVLYELPSGIDDCSNKRDIRCMAAGENVGNALSTWIRCTGVTGLRQGEGDNGETCGCPTGQNNFVAPINMEAGKSYALVINNFSKSGGGFRIQFGGTGTFQGPTADFKTDVPTNCVGKPFTFADASSFVGTIKSYEWNFGPDANIPTATGKGPHTVTYKTAGLKSILLTVETDRGCLVTKVGTVMMECCPDHFSTASGTARNLTCPSADNGAVDLNITTNYPPYSYAWSDSTKQANLANLKPGAYTVTVTDQATCDTVLTFNVTGPPPVSFDTLITKPTCGGGTDGSITLTVTGGTPPYQFNWQNRGFNSNNTLANIPRGDYTVVVRDSNNCDTTLIINVRELELALNSTVQAVTPPTCNGLANGVIQVNIANGLAPYQYDFGDGRGFQTAGSLTGLRAGTYRVQVRDANLCAGNFAFEITDYPALAISIDSTNVSCNGETDGSATVSVTGGVGTYTYLWSNGQTKATITDLIDGIYTVTAKDSNQCVITKAVTIVEPAPVVVKVDSIVNVICNGEKTGVIKVSGSGGTQPYSFGINGGTLQPSSTFSGLGAGTYAIRIEDVEGCGSTVTATLTQPQPLVVDAGLDQTIELGFTANLQAIANAAGVKWQWDTTERLSCIDCPNPTASPLNTTTYTIIVTNGDRCKATDQVTIIINKNRPIFAPNAFSPNDDGTNDFFTLFGNQAAELIEKIIIFDRWGNLVFEASQIALGYERLGWNGMFNGKPMGTGVYTYVAQVRFIDQEVLRYEGDVTIVR